MTTAAPIITARRLDDGRAQVTVTPVESWARATTYTQNRDISGRTFWLEDNAMWSLLPTHLGVAVSAAVQSLPTP